MKKTFVVVMIACLIFCLTGCVSQSELDAVIAERDSLLATVTEYEELIGLIEAEKYEEAIANIQSRIPEPEVETVEITMDNWEEYFEIVPHHYWYENAFGEGTGLYTGFSLFLKEAYASRLFTPGNSVVACTVSFDAREETLDINWKEKTFEKVPYTNLNQGSSSTGMDEGRYPEEPFEEACSITSELGVNNMVLTDEGSSPNLFWYANGWYEGADLYNLYFPENFSMVRITGTLELQAE